MFSELSCGPDGNSNNITANPTLPGLTPASPFCFAPFSSSALFYSSCVLKLYVQILNLMPEEHIHNCGYMIRHP